MSTVKRFAKYAIFLILFWILSDILIYVGLNSTYKNMQQVGEIPSGVEVIQMQSTKVNGRMKIKVSDSMLSGKFLKIDLYSNSGMNLGTQYIELGNIKEKDSKEFETYFKISDTHSYEITVVEEMGQSTEGFMDTALSTMTVIMAILKLILI